MGAAWRSPNDRDLDKLCDMVRGVSDLGLETCTTLGTLSPGQVARLKAASLEFYNHNIDTSPDYYARIATTRTREDRIAMLATLPAHPDSVPVNLWNEIEGVPVQERALPVEPFALVRIVALTRIVMPASVVRLSAGRTGMSDELQVLRFLAGANSIFVGHQILTTDNPAEWKDHDLLARLGMHVAPTQARPRVAAEWAQPGQLRARISTARAICPSSSAA